MRTIALVAAAFTVTCSPRRLPPAEEGWRPQTEGVDYGKYPTEFEALAKAWFAENLKDPESVQYRRLSLPRKEHAISNQFRREAVYGYSICVEYNAKNSFGGYTGFRVQWFLIRDNEIVRTHDAERPIYIGRYPTCEDGDAGPSPRSQP